MENKTQETINYLPKQNRYLEQPDCPPLEKINEINSVYSDIYDRITACLPQWTAHMLNLVYTYDEMTPHKLALAETILSMELGDDLECETYTLDIYTEEISQP